MIAGPSPTICSVVNDEFVAGFIVMADSLRRRNPAWRPSFMVIAERDESFLSEDGRDLIARHVPEATFRWVRREEFARVHMQARATFGTPARLVAAFYILEAFRLSDTDRVICLDSDILVTGRLDELLLDLGPFAAVRAWDPKTGEPACYVNTGVMVLDLARLQEFSGLRAIMAAVQGRKPKPGAGKADQAVLNLLFENDEIAYLPHRFNFTKRMAAELAGNANRADPLRAVEHLRAALAASDIRILHYVSEKPWQVKVNPAEQHFAVVDRLWWEAFEAIACPALRRHVALRRALKMQALTAGLSERATDAADPADPSRGLVRLAQAI